MENQNFIDRNRLLYKIYHESIFSGLLHKVKQAGIYIKFKLFAAIQYAESIPRSLGWKDRRFMALKLYKDKFKGKRCFIACTGPSLTIEDLESLKNEYVFGMNSICLIHEKTEWKPDFFGIQDYKVFEKVRDKLLSSDNGIIFAPYDYYKILNLKSWVYFPLCGAYHLYEMIYGPRYFSMFSDDCYIKVYDGYTITYSIMQLAIYMGFDELYLIGADCNYLGSHQHFIETGHYDPGAKNASEKMLSSYRIAKDYADRNGIKIINATRGGCLELFERMNLEDVLSTKEKNKIAQ